MPLCRGSQRSSSTAIPTAARASASVARARAAAAIIAPDLQRDNAPGQIAHGNQEAGGARDGDVGAAVALLDHETGNRQQLVAEALAQVGGKAVAPLDRKRAVTAPVNLGIA